MPRKGYSFAVKASSSAIFASHNGSHGSNKGDVLRKELGITEFMLEGDSEVVINTLRSKEASLSSFGHLLESTKSLLVTSKCIVFSYVRRTSNKVAHNLARYARHVRGLSMWVEDVPPHLYDILFVVPG